MNPQTRTILFNFSGLCLLAGTILYITGWMYAPYLFAVGAAGIAVSHLTVPLKGLDVRRRRLHRFNVFAGLLMVFASGLMFSNQSEWIICLSIAAVLQLYTAFVMPRE